MSEKIDIEQVDGIGALASLTTTDKSNLVNAINEVNTKHTDFGGVNLVYDSHFYNGNTNGWNNVYGTQVVENHIYKKTFTTLSSAARIERVFSNLKAGVYTLTIFVKTPRAISWYSFVNGTPITGASPSSPTEFARRSVTFSVPNDGNVTVRGYVPSIPVGSVIEIDWFKLETGYVGSDWTPNLEDQKSDWNETNPFKDSYIKNKPEIPNVTGFIPYTGANQLINFNTQTLNTEGLVQIQGVLSKTQSSLEMSRLVGTTASNHLRKYTDVTSASRGNDTSTLSDCVVIKLPIRTSTKWVMEVDIFGASSVSTFGGVVTLLIAGYGTNNSQRVVSVIGGDSDRVKSVSFCRDEQNNSVIIVRFESDSTNFTYGKVNINKFYHGVTYNSDLNVKSNFSVSFEQEESLTGLTTNGTITNAQFTRDSYLWNKGNFSQTDINNWNTAFGWGDHTGKYIGLNAIANGALNISTVDLNTPINGNYVAYQQSTSPNKPISGGGFLTNNYFYSASVHYNSQSFDSIEGNRFFKRHRQTAVWVELYHTGNFNPAQYVLQSALNTQLANYATKAGVNTFTNTNTFLESPYIPAGTLDGHAVNLGQLNSIIDNFDFVTDEALNSYIKKGVHNVNPEGEPFSIHANYGSLNWNGNGFSFFTDSEQEFSYIEDEQAIGVNPFQDYGFYLNHQRLRFSNAGNSSELLPSNGVSKSKLPVTGSTQRTLAVGATMGGNTYHANENGLISLPNIVPPSVNTTVKAYMPGDVFNNDTVHCSAFKTIIYLSPSFAGPLHIDIEPDLQDGSELIVIHTYVGSGPGLFNINGEFISHGGQLISTYPASQQKTYRFIYVKDLERFALVDVGQM